MKYAQQLNKEFVFKIVNEFLTTKWFAKYVDIRKHGYSWKVMFKIKNSNCYSVFFIDDFSANFGSKHMWCSYFDQKWRVELAKKFGKDYLYDLKEYLYQDFDKKSQPDKDLAISQLSEVIKKSAVDVAKEI